MKTMIKAGLVILFLAGTVGATELTLMDFGKFQLEVTDYHEIDNFTGENGDIIKPSRRDARFIEVELRCNTDVRGEIGLYPKMFSAMFYYREIATVVPAVAMGTKWVEKESGEYKEAWYNAPGVAIIVGLEAGETFTKYFILEIPKEVDNVIFQGPMSITSLNLKTQ